LIERLSFGEYIMQHIDELQVPLTRWFERQAPLIARVVTFVMTAVFILLLLAAGRAWVQFDVMQAAAMVDTATTETPEPM
jgi:hypothetical protein